MIPSSNLPVALLAALCLLTLVSAGAMNHSMNFTHFKYHGSWDESLGGHLDASGGHKLTNTPGSYATINYSFSSVYMLSAKWPYNVSTAYSIDGNKPFTIDMRDYSAHVTNGGNASKKADVVGHWSGTDTSKNQQHTINISLPSGADKSGMSSEFAVVDMFLFEVVTSSTSHTSTTSSKSGSSATTTTLTSHTSTTSNKIAAASSTFSTSTTSTNIGKSGSSTTTTSSSSTSPSQTSTTSASSPSSTSSSSTSSSSTSPSSTSPSSTSPSSSSVTSSVPPVVSSSAVVSPSPSPSHVSSIAISVSIVGTFLALLAFLLWRFCNRRQNKDRNEDIDLDPIIPHYDPVPTGIDNKNSFATRRASMRRGPMFTSGSDANVPLNPASISDDLQRPPNYHTVISSNNGPPSPRSPVAATTYHRLFTPKADSKTYSRIPILDGASASSGNRDVNEKRRNDSRGTLAEFQDEPLISNAIPERHEENVWDSGYAQPLKFVSII